MKFRSTLLSIKGRFWVKGGGLCISLGLLILLSSGTLTIGHPLLVTVIAFGLIYLLPGHLLSVLLLKHNDLSLLEYIPVSFVLGIGVSVVPGLLVLNLHWNMEIFAWMVVAIVGCLAVLYMFQLWRKRKERFTPSIRWVEFPDWLYLIVFAVVIALAMLLISNSMRASDDWSYMAYMQDYLELDQIALYEPVLGTTMPVYPRKHLFSVWYLLITLLAKLSRLHLVPLFQGYLPPLLVVMSLLAIYSLARELFQSPNAGVLAVLVEVVYYLSTANKNEPLGWNFFARIQEDNVASTVILLPVAVLLLLRYLSTDKRKYLVAFGLAVWVLMTTHIQGVFFCGLITVSFASLHLLLASRAQALKTGLILIPFLLVTPLVFWERASYRQYVKLLPLSIQANFHDIDERSSYGLDSLELQGQTFLPGDEAKGTRVDRLLVLGRDIYMAHPYLVIRYPLSILAILLMPWLLRDIKRNVAAQYLFSTMLTFLALMYIPLLTTFVGSIAASSLIYRFAWVLPIGLVLTYFLLKLADAIRRALAGLSPFYSRYLPGALPLALLAGLVLVLARGDVKNLYFRMVEDRVQWRVRPEMMGMLTYIQQNITTPSLIMANRPMNWYIPAFSASANVVFFADYIPGSEERQEDAIRFFSTERMTEQALAMLKKYDVTYVLIKRGEMLSSQFRWLSSLFTHRYEDNDYELYEVTGTVPSDHDRAATNGNMHFERREWEEAIAEYERALALDPDDTWAYFALGQIHQARGEIEQAEAAYLDAIHAEVYNVLVRVSLAQVYVAQGRTEEAIQQYEEAIRLCPDYLAPREGLGDIYLMQGRVDEAVAEYEKAIGLVPGTADHHSELGFLLHSKGLNERAIEEYLRAIDLDSYPSVLYCRLGTVYLAEKRLEDALEAYERAMKIRPYDAMARVGIGRVYEAQGEMEKAVAQYRKIIKMNPYLIGPYLALGNLHQDQGEIGEAITVYQQAIAMQPECVSCYCKLGEAYEARGESEQAIAVYQQAIEVGPDSATPYVLLGDLYRDLGEVEAAVDTYERAVALRPDSAYTYIALGKLYEEQGRVEEAVAIYKQATIVEPDRSDSHLLLGKLYKAQGNLKAAIEEYERAIEIDPDSAAPYVALGDLYRKEKRLEEALTAYRQAVMLNPDYVPGRIRLGAVYKALGDLEKALTVYQQAMAIEPDNQALWKAFPPLSGEQPMRIKLGDSVRFLGYAADSANVEADGSLRVTFYWQGLERMDTSYTVFVHLLGANGQFWGQEDTPPCQADCPTISWPLETVITDEHEITIDPQTPPGEYVLEMGMYDVATGERLGAYDQQLREWLPEARILLGKVVVR